MDCFRFARGLGHLESFLDHMIVLYDGSVRTQQDLLGVKQFEIFREWRIETSNMGRLWGGAGSLSTNEEATSCQ